MKRALIIKTSSMGDIIHTLPALTDAAKIFPDISFDWIIEETFAEIPAWHSSVDKVISVALRKWRKVFNHSWQKNELPLFMRKLREQKYDFVIDAQGLMKSAMVSLFARGERCGFNWKCAKESLASLAYKRKFHIPKQQHAITRVRQLFAESLSYNMPDNLPNYGISESFNISQSTQEKYLVFIHSTTRKDKLWTETKWIKLAKMADQEDYQIKLPWGTEDEYDRAKRIEKKCKNVKVLPKLSLTVIAEILLGAKAVVAVDTGLGHLAAALSVPTVSLYGPTDPKLIGTCGQNQIHLIARSNVLSNISVRQVWEALPLRR